MQSLFRVKLAKKLLVKKRKEVGLSLCFNSKSIFITCLSFWNFLLQKKLRDEAERLRKEEEERLKKEKATEEEAKRKAEQLRQVI